ncbi:MAG: DNA-binding protein, partial [Campylobacteraceae bacterium]|nr:DNA-binding protein [Campylobacteraceae bacterium]
MKNEQNNSNMVIYNDGELELNVSVENETVWLSQNQLCELFDRDKSVISRHIRNIFSDGELDKISTVAKNATVQFEGGREILREIEYYNLDVIIS